MQNMARRGYSSAYVTLHVGLGTFRPVKVSDPLEHEIHAERYQLNAEVVGTVERARARGGRVVAVGTTSVRVLEHCAKRDGCLHARSGDCDLYILPGYEFRVVDALITNFHLPRSTLLMLVSAFAGREHVLEAYRSAVQQRYRFYSYGDAMLIV